MSMKTTRHMELTIMPVGKKFKSNGLQRIFGRSNSISKDFVRHINNREEQILDKCEEITVRFLCGKNCKAVTQRILGTTENISRHLVTTRATRNDRENDKCM